MVQQAKNMQETQGTWVWSLGWEDPPEKGMAIHPSILALRIPWTEEPRGLQSKGSQRVRYDWVTKHTHEYTHTHTMLQSGYRKDQTRGEFYIKACSLLLPLLLMDDSLFLLSSVMEHCRPWSQPLCVYITFPLVGFHCRVLTSQRGNKWQVQVKVASWWQVLGVWC